MAYIGKPPVNGFFSKQAITGDGSTTSFALTVSVADPSSLIVSSGGVLQEPGAAYSLSGGGANIVFSEAPSSTDTTYVQFLGTEVTMNNFDTNGAELILDVNGNTSLHADTDDEIDIKVGGTDRSTIKATGYHNLDSIKFVAGTGDDMQMYHDGTNSYLTNSTGALKIATETSGIALTLGHSTSEVTFGDNVTVTGNLSIGGTTTFGDFDITNVGSIALDTITNDGTDITLDSSGDIVLDADGDNITLKAGGTTYGDLAQAGGELVIKSGSTPTTALTFAGANATFAGTLGVTGVATFTAVPVLPANSIDSAHYVDGSIDTAHFAAGSVDAAAMGANSVDSSELVDGSVDLSHMSVNSIDSDQYVDGSIDLVHMSANSVDSDQYVDGSIDLVHMSANSVDSDQYVDGSIDTAHIANDQITAALMADNSIDSDMYVDGSIDNAHLADDAVGVAELSATGTASSSTFLRGDNAWAAAGAITTYSNSTNNRVLTSVDSTSVNSEANLTFDGSTLAVTGAITVTSTVDGVDIQTLNTTASAALPKAGGTMTGDLILGDNVMVEIGSASGGDLRLYHDASNSYVNNQGTGHLLIRGDDVKIQDAASGHNMGVFVEDGGVELYHNNVKKFEVTSTGITVTGTAIATTDTDTSNSGSVTLDFATNQNFVLTLTGNVTLANPSTEQVGQSGFIACIQDGTGSRTLTLGTDYETAAGAGITLTTTASATDLIPYVVVAANRILLGKPQLAFS